MSNETPTPQVETPVVALPEVPVKVPFYKNPRYLKVAGYTTAVVAATALVCRKFSKNDDSDETNENPDFVDTQVIEFDN